MKLCSNLAYLLIAGLTSSVAHAQVVTPPSGDRVKNILMSPNVPVQAPASPSSTKQPEGRNGVAAAGVVGERQLPGNSTFMIDPLARLQTRVANRVENRIRNRVDRNYDPQANATSPFARADANARRQPVGPK